MNLEIYHQLGHNYNWSVESIRDDGTGDGIIIAPRHMEYAKVIKLSDTTKNTAIFDPQFFCPSIQKGKLSTYNFFPDIASNGFSTSEYGNSASKSAEEAVDFQLNNKVRYIIIPTRQVPGMPSSFIKNQQELFVSPFLSVIQKKQILPQKVVLQLILNEQMLKDESYFNDILNWITGIRGINGIYLITELSQRSKQIKDPDFLYSLLKFISLLNQNEFDVILGYLNIEALLLSIAHPKIITMGAYENLRMFNIRNFNTLEKKEQGPPTPRLYISKLLQWVDYRYIGAIKRELGDEDFFDENKYKAQMFEPTFKWHFTKPALYKHYFLEFSKQLRQAGNINGLERYKFVCSLIDTAQSYYAKMPGIQFDPESDGSHFAAWLTAANQFAKLQGWR